MPGDGHLIARSRQDAGDNPCQFLQGLRRIGGLVGEKRRICQIAQLNHQAFICDAGDDMAQDILHFHRFGADPGKFVLHMGLQHLDRVGGSAAVLLGAGAAGIAPAGAFATGA